MAIAIHGIIVVVDKIPANQIVDAAVSVIVDAVFPAGVVQQIAGIDAAVGVDVAYGTSICDIVEIAEGDQRIAIGIDQTKILRNFTGIEPDIEIKISVRVIDAGIDDANHRLGGTNKAAVPGLAGLAAELVGRTGGVTIHAPQTTIGVARVVAALHCDGRTGFSKCHNGVVCQRVHYRFGAASAAHLDHQQVTIGGAADHAGFAAAGIADCQSLIGRAGAGAELYQQFSDRAGGLRCHCRSTIANAKRTKGHLIVLG